MVKRTDRRRDPDTRDTGDVDDPTNGGSLPVEEGLPAPDFTLDSDTGEAVTLSSLRGSPVVLYFYPKDDTLPTNS